MNFARWNTRKNLWQVALLVCLALATLFSAGCSTAATPTSVAVLTPILTQTFLPSPLFAFTPSSTNTLAHTRTLAPTRTQTPTKTQTATPDRPTTTPNFPETVVAAKTPQAQEFFRSPNVKWDAHVIVRACLETPTANDLGYEELRVKNHETGQEILADSQTIFCGGLGAYGLKGFFWSKNNRYFYYTSARQGVPDGCGYWDKPYLSFDVQTQKKEYIGGGPLSPDKMRLAAWRDKEIVIWDLNRGEIARHQLDPEDDRVPGPIAWSPDGQSVVYLQTSSWCPPEGSYLTRLDAPNFQPAFERQLLYGDFADVRWESANELRLFDSDSIEWRYIISENKLEPLTFTPQPPKGEWKEFTSDKYHFSFRYPANWDSDCCRIGGYAGTESIITLADPRTGGPNTDVPCNGFAVNVIKKPVGMTFREFVGIEKQHLAQRQQLGESIVSPPITESEVPFSGQSGVLLQADKGYIFVPLNENQILVIVATLQRKLEWDNTLKNIFATFQFE